MESWLDLDNVGKWDSENPPELYRPLVSYPLWIACRGVDFAHLPGDLPIEQQPDWLVHDFALYTARYEIMRVRKRKEDERRN